MQTDHIQTKEKSQLMKNQVKFKVRNTEQHINLNNLYCWIPVKP